jgi:hypothetical protein
MVIFASARRIRFRETSGAAGSKDEVGIVGPSEPVSRVEYDLDLLARTVYQQSSWGEI